MDLDKISENFSKYMFKFSDSTRVELFKVVISSLNHGIGIKQTIERRIQKHHKRHAKLGFVKKLASSPGGSEMPFLIHANKTLLKGETFSNAVKGWVTDNEMMLVESGGDGELESSLNMAQDLLLSLGKIKSSVRAKMTYPVILFLALIGMILAFSFKMLPILTSLSDPEKWEGSSKSLYDFCMFFKDNVQYVIGGIFVFGFGIMKTLPIWTGKVRNIFDGFFPWSVYKEFNAGIFLISLSTLMQSGLTLLNSLQALKAQSPLYVRVEIDKMIAKTKAAESSATAINTGFLGDIGDDIEDLAEFGDFESTLLEYGNSSVDLIIESIGGKADKIKSVMLFCVVGFVGWGYGTFMAISQTVTDNI
jgi:23S rRNA pseudoU1915 N3-methylase RlmH